MSNKLLTMGLPLLLLSMPSFAQSGSNSAAFLDIPIGGRPAALGGAYSALASDAYAPVWNPAGLPRVGRSQVAATHLFYLQDMSSDYFSVVVPFKGRHGFGVSTQFLRSGDIPATDSLGRPIGAVRANYSAFTLAYGLTLNSRWSVGVAPKAVVASLDHDTAAAYAADAGVSFLATPRLRFGAVVANMGTSLGRDALPAAVRFGGAYEAFGGILGTAELCHAFSGVTDVRGGVEWTIYPGFSLRVGAHGHGGEEQWRSFAGGIGFAVLGQELDYAWVPEGSLGSTHFITLVAGFGKPSP